MTYVDLDGGRRHAAPTCLGIRHNRHLYTPRQHTAGLSAAKGFILVTDATHKCFHIPRYSCSFGTTPLPLSSTRLTL
jgi:hypothetical protein